MRMILAVMEREYRIRVTSFTWLFYDLLMPLTYLVMFGMGFDRAFGDGIEVAGSSMTYRQFFLPGVIAMACFGIGINTSYGFFVDRENGIFYEFLTYPMTRGEFLIGKILFNCMMALLQSILTVGIGFAFMDIPAVFRYLPYTVLAVTLGTAGWFFFLATFALRIRRNDAFNTFINAAYFLLMFASSMFYPVEGLPAWLQVFSYINPMTWHSDVLRWSLTGVGDAGRILAESGAYLLFLLVFFTTAVRALRAAAEL